MPLTEDVAFLYDVRQRGDRLLQYLQQPDEREMCSLGMLCQHGSAPVS